MRSGRIKIVKVYTTFGMYKMLLRVKRGEIGMTYQAEEYKKYIEKLQELKEIAWVNNHLELMKKPNFWTIVEFGEHRGTQDKSAHERRSSKMLRWLMDANETHGLGNAFAYKLLNLIGVNYTFNPSKNKDIKATVEDMDIDVLYKDTSQNICLAIELKQYAKEGKTKDDESQLNKYKRLLEERIVQNNLAIQPYYIYLTPTKDEPSNKHWQPVSYQELITIIQQVLTEYLEVLDNAYVEHSKKIIADFKDDLQRTLDYLHKNHKEITAMLTDRERELTLALAEEIEHETEAKYLAELEVHNTENDSDIHNLILIIKDYITAQRQNHNPNDAIRILIRKMYNYLSADKQLAIDKLENYGVGQCISPIKAALIDKYNLGYNRVETTSRKGQGLYLHHKDHKQRIYLSGDAYGNFPNDGIQLLNKESATILLAQHIEKNQFNVQHEQIIENDISCKSGATINLQTLMETYVMTAIEELNARQAQ